MKTLNTIICRSTLLALSAFVVLTGCSKKDEPEPQSAPAPSAPEAPAAQYTPRQTQPNGFAATGQPEQWIQEAETYQQTGDYDKAAQYLIAIQRQQQQLSEQQAAAYWKQMSSFQSDLAARVAAGDPSAIAAAERLRASANQ